MLVKVLERQGYLPSVHPRGLQVHFDRVAAEKLEQVSPGQKVQPVVQEVSSAPGAPERHDEGVFPQDAQDLPLIQHPGEGGSLVEGHLLHREEPVPVTVSSAEVVAVRRCRDGSDGSSTVCGGVITVCAAAATTTTAAAITCAVLAAALLVSLGDSGGGGEAHHPHRSRRGLPRMSAAAAARCRDAAAASAPGQQRRGRGSPGGSFGTLVPAHQQHLAEVALADDGQGLKLLERDFWTAVLRSRCGRWHGGGNGGGTTKSKTCRTGVEGKGRRERVASFSTRQAWE